MPVVPSETPSPPTLNTSREPKLTVAQGGNGSLGETALNDALLIVGIAWLVLAVFVFTLRTHNI